MENQTAQPEPIIEEEIARKKKFAQEAGLSLEQLTLLQNQTNKRQTRHKRQTKQIHEIDFKKVLPLTPVQQSFISTPNDISTSNHISNKIVKNSKANIATKTPKVNEKQLKKLQISPPKSVDEFYQSFLNFFTSIFPNNQKDVKFIQLKKAQLFDLLNAVISHGGIVNVISNGQKVQILTSFAQSFSSVDAQQVFQIYKKYLLHFEYYLLENATFKEYHDPTPLFGEATFVSENQLSNFLDKTPLDPKYFEYDILVFRNGQNAIGIDSEQISLAKVRQHYKEYNIDIRIQKALDYGFKPKTMRNQPYQMKVGDYGTYQKLSQQYALNQMKIDSDFIQRLGKLKELDVNGTSFKQRVKSQEIFFGVNFDPEDGILFDYIGEKTNGTFIGFKQQFDFLSYLDHQVPGCSFPQFYFKVKGVWTGGHQENINMCAVNINHGPDASQWYTMEFEYVEQFRAQLKKQFKMDLYAGQGLWYQKINWFVEQGRYPIKKIIQKKGDIVISGPGTLHWVRSHGVALQSAWNQFPITYNALKYAFHRQEQNEKIHFIRSNVIPLKRLTLKLLNHPRRQLTPQIKSLCVEKIRCWIQKQEEIFESLINEQNSDFAEEQRFEKLDDLQGFCMKCKQQILIYFVNGRSSSDVICLNCYKKQFKGKRKSRRVYIRHQVSKILQLIRLTQLGQPFDEIQAFCSNYVGNVPFECSKNKRKVQKDAIFLQKVNNMNKDLNKYDEQRLKQMTQKVNNKRKASEKQDEQQSQVKNQSRNPEQMQLQINQIFPSKPKQPTQYRIKNNVRYHGRWPNKSGWWDFEIPQQLLIMRQNNHQELLKLIEEQQYFMKQYAKRQHRQFPSFNYKIMFRNSNSYQPLMAQMKEAQFSSQSQEQNIQGRKKNHKNEDTEPNNLKTQQSSLKFNEKDTVEKQDFGKNDYKDKVEVKQKQIELQQNKSRSSVSRNKKQRSQSISPQKHRKQGKDKKQSKYRDRDYYQKEQKYDRYDNRRRYQSFRDKQRENSNRKQKSYQQKDQRKYNNQRSSSRYHEDSKYRDYQRKEKSSHRQQKRERQFTQKRDHHRNQRGQQTRRYSKDRRDNYDRRDKKQSQNYSYKPSYDRNRDQSSFGYQKKQSRNHQDTYRAKQNKKNEQDKNIQIQY